MFPSMPSSSFAHCASLEACGLMQAMPAAHQGHHSSYSLTASHPGGAILQAPNSMRIRRLRVVASGSSRDGKGALSESGSSFSINGAAHDVPEKRNCVIPSHWNWDVIAANTIKVAAGLTLSVHIVWAVPSSEAVDALKTCACLLKECRVELARCIADPACAANVTSLQTWNNRLDETQCQKFAGMSGNCQAGQFGWLVLYVARLLKSFRKYTIIAGSRMDATNKCVQSAMQEVARHVLDLHLSYQNLYCHLRPTHVFKCIAVNEGSKLTLSLKQSPQRRFLFGVLGSVIVAIFVTIGSPSSSSNSTWALTEENLIFLEAWRTIDRAYIDKTFNGQSWFRYREEALKREPMNNREQTYAAIRKMLATLEDPFTRFLEPEKFKSLRTGTRGAVTGVGLEVGFDISDGVNSNLVVIAPVIGGPAERAGVLPGDVISEIDGIPTKGMSLYDAAQRLQGPESSEVKLTLHNVKGGSPKTLVLVRESIQINPVTWSLCDVAEDGQDPVKIGYIRLATFNENAARSLRESILKLKENGATAYILDIRNNSGGLFPAGIEIAKLWLEKGVIVYIADNMGIRDIYEADGNETVATSEPLAVLVNKGTASASEILAGALKDNKRAVILGEPTFGKGKIQSVFQLSDGSGMAVTIARYETPAHIDIDKVGITPDHPLPPSAPLDKDSFCRCLVDSSLSCHMLPSTFFK